MVGRGISPVLLLLRLFRVGVGRTAAVARVRHSAPERPGRPHALRPRRHRPFPRGLSFPRWLRSPCRRNRRIIFEIAFLGGDSGGKESILDSVQYWVKATGLFREDLQSWLCRCGGLYFVEE